MLGDREREIMWAAGFWDGEGHAYYDRRYNPNGYLSLVLAQAEASLDALERFARIAGYGNIKGPYGPYGNNQQSNYRWTVGGKKAVIVATMLEPHVCSSKRVQFALTPTVEPALELVSAG
jgi:hypothetical protein